MAQWCADNWESEPALSQIRDWVGPAFKAIRGTENGVDKTAPDLSASSA